MLLHPTESPFLWPPVVPCTAATAGEAAPLREVETICSLLLCKLLVLHSAQGMPAA